MDSDPPQLLGSDAGLAYISRFRLASRYVFHNARNCLNMSISFIAIRLARGHRIALAQPVPANIYRYLSLLHMTIASDGLKATLKSPFYLFQVWAGMGKSFGP